MSLDQRLRNGLVGSAERVDVDHTAALRAVRQGARRRQRVVTGLRALAVAAAVVAIALAAFGLQRLVVTDDTVDPVSEPDLVGTYAVVVPASEVAEQAGLVGRWEVALRQDGTVRLTPPSTDYPFSRDGTYRTEQGVFRTDLLLDVPGCQVADTQVGTYRWARVGDELRFTVVEDGCAARRELLTPTWKATP